MNSQISENQGSRKFKVLVADDEGDARILIGAALSQENLEISFFENGQDCVESCKQQFPDLAIVDIQMPFLDGIEVCRWIKANCGTKFVPVILLTSLDELSDKVNGLNRGADDYITKPFSFPELAARVRAFLRIKSLTEQLRATRNLLAEKEKELLATQVAGAAAHELGQPLTSIVLNCELLSALDPTGPEFRSSVTAIAEDCRRMKELLAKLHSVTNYKLKPYAENMEILDIVQDEAS